MSAVGAYGSEERAGEVFATAVASGCAPEWSDGMFGYAWHCTCSDNTHGCDQQCSAITLRSAKHRSGD